MEIEFEEYRHTDFSGAQGMYIIVQRYTKNTQTNIHVYYSARGSTWYTYRLNRLKPKASTFRGPPAKVYNIFNTVIGLSHLCCHSVLYFLNNPTVIFLTQLHSHFRMLPNCKHPSSSSPLLKWIKHTSIFLQSWRWGIGRGITSGIAYDLSLSKSGTG